MTTFVLDETDRNLRRLPPPVMLSRGFEDQIYDVFKAMLSNIQVCLFSATMAPMILDLTAKFTRDAVRILVRKDELTLEGRGAEVRAGLAPRSDLVLD